MKKYLLLFISILFLFPVSACALDLELSREDTLTDGCRADDGVSYYSCDNEQMILSYDNTGKVDGHLLLLRNSINKYDLDGDLVFSKTVDDLFNYFTLLDVIEVEKEVNSKVKGNTDILITFYNFDDEVVFEKLYGGNGEESLDYFIPTFDNKGKFDGYMFFINSTSTDLASVKAGNIIVKIDLKGNILWQHNDIKNDVFVYNNDGTINSYFDIDGSSAVRKEFDTDNVIWSKEITKWGMSVIASYDKNNKVNGAFAVGFSVCSHSTRYGTIAVYDLDGNEIFSDSTYDFDKQGCKESHFSKIFNSKNVNGVHDGYLALGTFFDHNFFIKYSSDGKVLWKTTMPFFEIFDITESYNSDGKFNGYVVLAQDENDLIILRYTYPSYKIGRKEDKEGTITVKENAYPGELVKVKVVVKEGYSLQRIIVKDENGKEIKVNSDGTFVMPEGKVTVSAIYKRITNPDTVSAAYMVLGVILIVSVGGLIVIKRRNVNY